MKTTPKDFFVWAGAMITLYVSVFSFITLLFSYIDRVFPDPLASYVDPYSGAMRFAISSLLVLFPVFLVLMRIIRADIAHMPEKHDLWVRRWALVFTVFIAGATVVIDFIVLINNFLGGDLTRVFAAKAVVILLVAGAGFLHFLADIRGWWDAHTTQLKVVAASVGVMVAFSIVAAFFVMGSPFQMRLVRLDEQKTNDLQNISWELVNYWQAHEALPTELSALEDDISGWRVPTDAQTGGAYKYEKTGDLSFALCTTFNTEKIDAVSGPKPTVYYADSISGGSWTHGVGDVCFERTIDPERYPPNTKMR